MARPKDNEMRSRILVAGTELFFERGFDAVSMKDIGEKVGISLSLAQSYYGKKSNILMQFFFNYFMDIAEFATKRLSTNQRLLTKEQSAHFYCVVAYLTYRHFHRNNDKLLKLYSTVLFDSELLFRGTQFTLDQYDAITGKGLETNFQANIIHVGAMSQLMYFYLDNPRACDFEELLAQGCRVYLQAAGFDDSVVTELIERSGNAVSESVLDEFEQFISDGRLYYIDTVY